jgi:acetyl-CoA C-acetyltransferase
VHLANSLRRIPSDPHAPVLAAAGQSVRRPGEPECSPLELMVRAAREAGATDTGQRLLERVRSVAVVDCLSWPVPDPGSLLAAELGLGGVETVRTLTSGTGPLDLLADACAEIQDGRLEAALIAGAEAILPFKRSLQEGELTDWPEQEPETAPTRVLGDPRPASHEAEMAAGLLAPVHYYPWFESALGAAAGETPEEHRERVARLWRRFAEVAVGNPYAWTREAPPPERILEHAENRMVAFPYSKLMTANIQVDQGAAVLLCRARDAASVGLTPEDCVYVHATAAAHDHWHAASRQELHRSPAITACARATLGHAGLGIDDVAHLDLYSCFPSAVQIAAAELGVDLEGPGRPPTVTGGLTFAGGPGSNYVTHSLVTMAERLRKSPEEYGFLTGVGWYMTKHANALLSTRPPERPYAHAEPQAEVDALPRREIAEPAAPEEPVEAFTVVYARDGTPGQAIFSALRPDGSRALGSSADAGFVQALLAGETAGQAQTS